MLGIAKYNKQRCTELNKDLHKDCSTHTRGIRALEEAQKSETFFQVYQNKITLLPTYNIWSRSCIYVGQYFIKNPKPITGVFSDQKDALENFVKDLGSPPIENEELVKKLPSLLSINKSTISPSKRNVKKVYPENLNSEFTLRTQKECLIEQVQNALTQPPKSKSEAKLQEEALRLMKPFEMSNNPLVETEAKRQLHTERMVGGILLVGGFSAVAFTTAIFAKKNFQ